MPLKRLLFASCHSYIDLSSGAALATRDLLELLAARGMECRVFSAGVLDFEAETSLESVVATLGVPYDRADARLSDGSKVEVLDLELNGVRVTLLPTASSRAERAPNRAEGRAFLELAEQAMASFLHQCRQIPRFLQGPQGHR